LAPHVLDDSILLVSMILLLLFLGLCQAALNTSQQQLDRKLVRFLPVVLLLFVVCCCLLLSTVVVDCSLRDLALVYGDADVARTSA
jgi:hypothetical protein